MGYPEKEAGRRKLGGGGWEKEARRRLGRGAWEEEAGAGGNPGGGPWPEVAMGDKKGEKCVTVCKNRPLVMSKVEKMVQSV